MRNQLSIKILSTNAKLAPGLISSLRTFLPHELGTVKDIY